MYNIALVDDDQRILQIVHYKSKKYFNSVGIDLNMYFVLIILKNFIWIHIMDVLFLDIDIQVSLSQTELAQTISTEP